MRSDVLLGLLASLPPHNGPLKHNSRFHSGREGRGSLDNFRPVLIDFVLIGLTGIFNLPLPHPNVSDGVYFSSLALDSRKRAFLSRPKPSGSATSGTSVGRAHQFY